MFAIFKKIGILTQKVKKKIHSTTEGIKKATEEKKQREIDKNIEKYLSLMDELDDLGASHIVDKLCKTDLNKKERREKENDIEILKNEEKNLLIKRENEKIEEARNDNEWIMAQINEVRKKTNSVFKNNEKSEREEHNFGENYKGEPEKGI